eukprot:CAMPEP_0174928900 /NCGR_PEP_ID=MMETSP1355-20121228/26741_1 /TAXON_ID=464990 /ORGANISM="Hemiselmis tepida, Strain CCMP443" /LENGTH=323 /DNA_ID=CAMNT_0016175081 /DNA_START=17 /DNA_END=988 /DNA_ORIENTATION=-
MLRQILCVSLLVASADAFGMSATMGLGLRSVKGPAIAGRQGGRAAGALQMMGDTPLRTIELKNAEGHTATVYPFGACVSSYKAPHEVLFIRPDAKLDGSKPISGGVPHCFPQFGPGEIQQHGFARNLVWDVRDVRADEPDMQQVVMTLRDNDETMAMWPNKFEATYTVSLEEDRMDLELVVKNTDDKAWDFQAALHTYFHVTDIDKCEVTGAFKGATYLDKMQDPPKEVKETRDAVVFDKEVDSVYKGVTGEVALVNKVNDAQTTTLRNLKGWKDTVLWSPYGNDGMGYKNFACVESAAVTPETLKPGESWNAICSIIPGPSK